MNRTLDYYNENADSFTGDTLDVVFSDVQDRFLSHLQEGAYILDFGCGSGRDSKYFLNKGYKVDAIDGSEKLCEAASKFTGIEVKCKLFSDLDDIDKYDGIWACASILHLPKEELESVFEKMIKALKPGGTIYASFKYSQFEGYRKGRYFTDFTSETFQKFVGEFHELTVVEEWISSDVRPGRSDEKWLNLILQKSDTI